MNIASIFEGYTKYVAPEMTTRIVNDTDSKLFELDDETNQVEEVEKTVEKIETGLSDDDVTKIATKVAEIMNKGGE